ncbi:MAG: translesion error-prone DNA polymerase V autoproteolytic subunit [Bacteroidales bacterium]|nr:translesion error-prone DNA polymerase V autoproteolytic subunit [Bacteroidales bacterium]
MSRKSTKNPEFFIPMPESDGQLPLFSHTIPAGFPSPAEDFLEKRLDLNEHLVTNGPASFLVRVKGESMVGAGIQDNDILVVDRSLDPLPGKVILGVLNGEFTVKRLEKAHDRIFLVAENERFPRIELREGMDFQVWGVVTWALHRMT